MSLPPQDIQIAPVVGPRSLGATCFMSTTIVPLTKKNTVTCLNDYCPIALTPISMQCFERIVMSHIKRNIPTTLDPFQFAYQQNRSTEDAVNAAIHTTLTHLEGKDTYVKMLFINYSLAFNTVIPHRLSEKLLTLRLTPSPCNWVLNFLMDRPPSVTVGNRTDIRHQNCEHRDSPRMFPKPTAVHPLHL
ncbi:hypothetical protein QTP70_026460 [Hemibagrus guttatus]|uniref:Reverse transcriptase domain-containing protein n=1 Tax=Hemibagrus guttatus TaxID=175788 RepID=A0AAE0Q8G9_9TELE|nr:hypothetical protein QTP70_026460 [Hemibagrus guttatus]